MPVFALIDAPIFPKPALAEPNGLLAVGGDLRLERLVAAYRNGIFPWYDAESPILWWSPDPRPVVLPGGLQVARRLERTIRSGKFKVTLDADFSGVIRGCAGVRREAGDGTWLVPEMIAAYERLHAAGYAHSAEAWLDGALVGGAYGVAIGRAFFGESMFHRVTDASKVAFVALARFLGEQGNSGASIASRRPGIYVGSGRSRCPGGSLCVSCGRPGNVPICPGRGVWTDVRARQRPGGAQQGQPCEQRKNAHEHGQRAALAESGHLPPHCGQHDPDFAAEGFHVVGIGLEVLGVQSAFQAAVRIDVVQAFGSRAGVQIQPRGAPQPADKDEYAQPVHSPRHPSHKKTPLPVPGPGG